MLPDNSARLSFKAATTGGSAIPRILLKRWGYAPHAGGILQAALGGGCYIRPLKTANTVLVNHHHKLALSRVWGDGSRSSSDGQRFAVERDSLLGAFYPRYFGYYERALTLYTHTADQHSVYATCAISCAPREAGPVPRRTLRDSPPLPHSP